jgi:hypothetical protein
MKSRMRKYRVTKVLSRVCNRLLRICMLNDVDKAL